MADLLKQGAEWLAGQLASHAAQQCVYHQVGNQSAIGYEFSATLSETEFEFQDEAGYVTRFQTRDFVAPAAGFRTRFGPAFEPQDGDWIEDGGKKYELVKANGNQCFRFNDSHRVSYRFHTKRIA